MFDFPGTPTNGQMFTPVAGGPSYVFQSPVWRLAAGGVNPGFWVGDAPPSSPVQGTLWWESDSGNSFIWYDDGSSAQWVQFNIAPPAAGFVPITAQAQNRIVNPAMQISQENGNTSGTAAPYYLADQFRHSMTGAGVFTGQRVALVTPNKSLYRLRTQCSTVDATLATNDNYALMTFVEGVRMADFGWGAVGARQAVLRFGFKAPAGTYFVSLRNNAIDRSWIAPIVISAAQANIDTEQLFVIPGDVTGTWLTDTGVGIFLAWSVAAGPDRVGGLGWQAGNITAGPSGTNGAASTSNIFELFDVGLYLDPDATGLAPPWEMPDEAAELLACQRYYEKSYEMTGYPGVASGPGAIGWQQSATSTAHLNSQRPFKVTKRVAPTMTAYNPATGAQGVRNISAASDFTVSSWTWTGQNSTGYISTSAAPSVADQQFAYHFVASARM